MIPKETVDKIFDAARIEEVVGDFVTLKKRGVNMIGLCPFHNEKTPSFNVNVARGIYKCFGCGKGGSAVNFVMEHEKLAYPEALRYLAKKYNIEIEEEELTLEKQAEQNERESLFIVSSFAQKHFTENLHNTDEGKAIGLSYFQERGFRNDIIEKFQLGYCLDTWRGFTDAAVAAGYKIDYLVKTGLTIQKENPESRIQNPEGQAENQQSTINNQQYFDRFKARVIFPIHNVTGRVIAFGGRTLKSDKKLAKYVNSPESEIYHKSNVLYGIYFAKKEIITQDNCYLVEGYTDVISLHQAGIENVVASSGTSLTVEQIRQIRRYTQNITILYDGDSAGIKASFRGIDLILQEGMNVKVLLFPDGDDPDSYSKRVSYEELKKFIAENSKDFISFKTSLLMAEVQNDPIKKANLIRDIVSSIAVIPEAINRSVYVKECSRIMELSEQVLLNELNKLRRKNLSNQQQKNESYVEDVYVPEELLEKQKGISSDDCAAQEKDVIRILLNFGKEKVIVTSEDEEKNSVDVEITVAELIHMELAGDQIEMENPAYQGILKEYANGALPDANHFINHPDPIICKSVVDLLSSAYSLSMNWEKHGILVKTENHMLKRSVLSALYSLKVKRIAKMILENQKQLKETSSDDDMMTLLHQQKQLSEAKKHFSAELGRIVIS